MSGLRASAVVVALLASACSGGGGGGGAEPAGGRGDGDGDAASASVPVPPGAEATEVTTTTAAEPVELAPGKELALEVGQCFAAIVDDPDATTTTVGAATRPVEEPDGDPVRVVDCGAAHDGEVYAASCLAAGADGRLGEGDCPGDPELAWPGTREVRRAAVRLCLARFESHVGEPYATSERETIELVPDERAWEAGGRRVVCALVPPT